MNYESDTREHNEPAIEQTRQWIQSVVVGLNFCPFAKRELDRNRVRFVTCNSTKKKTALLKCAEEFQLLDNDANIETTVLVLPKGFYDFYTYMGLVDDVDDLLHTNAYEGIYQVASFHPDYCFEDEDFDDPANFTNRSPYPLLHFLRETSLDNAIASHSDIDSIHENNRQKARALGLDAMKVLQGRTS